MRVGLMLPAMISVEFSEMALHGAEGFGFDSMWLPDHMLGPSHPALWPDVAASAALPDPDAWLDPFCVAAILSRQTSRTIGTCVTDTTRRRGADLARASLTVQGTTRGEFVLGLGSGEAESLLPFGYDFTRPLGLLEQALREIRSLFDTGAMPDGVGRTGLVGPGARIPKVWVAGNGPRALRLTGTYADGWLPMGGISPIEYARQREVVSAAAHAAGRPDPEAAYFPLVVLGESRAQVGEVFERDALSKMILLFAPAALWQRYGLEHPAGPTCRGYPDTIPHALDPEQTRQALAAVPLEMVQEFVMTGNAEDIAAQLGPYREAGMQHVVLADLTGMTFDPATAAALMPQLGRLCELLHHEPAVSAVS